MNNKNTKASPCEAAWKKWANENIIGFHPAFCKGEESAFSAGFRAGEEGKAELLEALEELEREADVNCCSTDGYERSKKAFAKARAAIAKHTAK